MMVIPHPPKLQLMPSMQLPIKTSVFQTSAAGVSMHNIPKFPKGLAQDEEKNEKMANYGSCRHEAGFFTSEMPSIRVECRAYNASHYFEWKSCNI